MEDLEALNRRTNLPMRMILGRPHQQQEELLWEEIQENKKYEEYMAICDIREEDRNNIQKKMGKPKRKTHRWG